MALGDTNTQSNEGRSFDRTYYGSTRIKNKDGLAIEFQFTKGLLILMISKEIEGFKYEPIEQIRISPIKARKFLEDIDTFIGKVENGTIDSDHAYGFNSGIKETVSFIALKRTGNGPIEHEIVVGKINSKGEITAQTQFVFNTDYDYSLEWSDFTSMKVEKVYDQFGGLRTLRDVINQFVNSYTGAIGASVWYSGKYDVRNYITKRFDAIYDKLGISLSNNNSGGNYFDSRAMNPPQQPHSNPKTYEEIEDMME